MTLTTGLVRDLDEREYHADTGSLSVSGAKTILKAPALFRHQRQNPVHSDAFDFGTAAHKKVLGVGSELVLFEFDPEKVKSPKSTNAWKDAQAACRSRGAVLLLPDELERVEAMAVALKDNTTAMRLLSNGEPEVSAYAVDQATGVLRRGRFDWLTTGCLVDYKTAASASPEAFASAAANYGYDMQADWYLWLAAACDVLANAFAFIVQEKEPPYLIEVYELDETFLQRGHTLNRRAIERYRDCMESGIWPGYTGRDFTTLTPPRWATFYGDES